MGLSGFYIASDKLILGERKGFEPCINGSGWASRKFLAVSPTIPKSELLTRGNGVASGIHIEGLQARYNQRAVGC
jgi:hypothetical protein